MTARKSGFQKYEKDDVIHHILFAFHRVILIFTDFIDLYQNIHLFIKK